MAASADAVDLRRAQLLQLGFGFVVFASLGLGLLVRIPDGADFGFSLLRHGPQLLLALAVGSAFGAAGASQAATDPDGGAHPYLLAVSAGGAFGAMRGFDAFGGEAFGFVLGGAVGALVLVAIVAGANRLPGVRRIALAAVLLGAIGLGAFAMVAAKGDPLGARPAVFWLLGDLSRARWATAVPMAILLFGLTIRLVRLPDRDGSAGASLGGSAALLFGLSLGVAGLVSFFAWMVAGAARSLLGGSDLRAWVRFSAVLGAAGMVWAVSLPPALFGGFTPPVGLAVAMTAVPWFLLRGDGKSSRGIRIAEVALGVVTLVGVLLFAYVLRQVAIVIA